jgi:hypothetical protein
LVDNRVALCGTCDCDRARDQRPIANIKHWEDNRWSLEMEMFRQTSKKLLLIEAVQCCFVQHQVFDILQPECPQTGQGEIFQFRKSIFSGSLLRHSSGDIAAKSFESGQTILTLWNPIELIGLAFCRKNWTSVV